MTDDDQVALIDLDGTVADFEKAVLRELGKIVSPPELESLGPHIDRWVVWEKYKEIDWLDARVDLIKKQPGFWENLPPIVTGLRICNLLEELGYRLMVLTKGPRKTTSAWTEKYHWVQKHMPNDTDTTVTHDKSLVYGKVLFDDWPNYIEPWLKHRPRGKVLMMDSAWNSGFEHPQVMRVYRYHNLQVEQSEQLKAITQFLT